MRLPATGGFDTMVADLTSNIFTQLGFEPAAADELSGELKAGLTAGKAAGAELHMQFQVREGELEILISQGERRLCRVTRRLP